MRKGRKKKNAGRPIIGKTKRVSITLPEKAWKEIEELNLPTATYFRLLVLDRIGQVDMFEELNKREEREEPIN